jgi:hypothetical protein
MMRLVLVRAFLLHTSKNAAEPPLHREVTIVATSQRSMKVLTHCVGPSFIVPYRYCPYPRACLTQRAVRCHFIRRKSIG